jgi:chromate transporter
MLYLQLFWNFFKTGLFAVGGGMATIPFLYDMSDATGWFTHTDLANMIAVSESTPGPIAINMATFVGSSQAGVLGSICATFGVVLPSFIIILLIAMVLHNLLKIKAVNSFINGIKPSIVGLISATFITLFLSNIFGISSLEETKLIFNYQGLIIFVIVVGTSIAYKKIIKKAVSPILLILLSGILGILFYAL